ncbi:20636_t:CDS:1, partial [Funneliformis geosporum]
KIGDFSINVAITIKNLSPEIVYTEPEVFNRYNPRVGVIVYHFENRNESLAFMWNVPFNYAFYSNWWNIKVYKGCIRADQ